MALPEVNNMPQPDLALTRGQRIDKGVGQAYVDTYNQLQMARYNNEYNYWLWRQQMEYNSPSNQVQRLKEAGLNPNFNSIDGTGNASSIPSSSGSISPSVGRNASQMTGNMISLASTIIDGFNKGLNAISTLSDTPPLSKLPEYRDILFKLGKENLKGKEYDNYKSLVQSIVDTYLAGGSQIPLQIFDENGNITDEVTNYPFALTHPDTAIGGVVFEPDKMLARMKAEADYRLTNQRIDNLGVDFDIKKLVEAAKRYYNTEIQPQEAEIAKGRAGMGSLGQIIQKVANGERLSFNDILAAILALAALKM